MKKKKSYIKLFNIPSVAKQAIAMLSENPPRSYGAIAEKLGCDRSSVIHFHKNKIKDGITLNNFNGVKVEIIGGVQVLEPEVINVGRNYKDYLKKYKKEVSKIRVKNMQKAKKTIASLRKTREDNGIDYDFDIWEF